MLTNLDEVKGHITSNIFEAKRDNVRAALPQAVIAAASHCKQHKYSLFFSLVCSFITLSIVPKFTGNARLRYKRNSGFSLFTRKGMKTKDTSLPQKNMLLGHSLMAWRFSSTSFMIGYVTRNQHV